MESQIQSPRDAARTSFADALRYRKDISDKIKILEKERGNVNYTSRFEEVEQILAQLRLACMQTIFHDFEYADSKKTESILWAAHTYLNTEYRNIVGRLVAQNQVVQKRKLEKLYRDFIKTSQSFYRAYIQRLSGRFCIPELRLAAQDLKLDSTGTSLHDDALPDQLREMLVKSCHSSLNHLGDLSRYRCQASDKFSQASFDNAAAYYCLANLIDPDDGVAHHQLAVLYRLQTRHLDIVYHFHRSICIAKPHQLGLDNLAKEFRSIRTSQIARRSSAKDPSEAMVAWFLRLHAFYFEGAPFSQQQELEAEVLHHLELTMKAQGFEAILMKTALINIAAYNVAKIKVEKAWTANGSRHCQYVLRFIICTIYELLGFVKVALQDDRGHSIDVESGSGESPLAFGPMLMNLFPLIRIYIAWMYSLRADLVAYRQYLEIHITEVYKLLADILTSLNSLVASTASTIRSQYLLVEDEQAIGLGPLDDQILPLFLQTELVQDANPPKTHRTRKPTRQVLSRTYKPQTEALWRIRDIIYCGLLLAKSIDLPLDMVLKIQDDREIEVWTYLDEFIPPKCVEVIPMDRILSRLNLSDMKSIFTTDPVQQSAPTRATQASGNLSQPSLPGTLDGAPEELPIQTEKAKSVDERAHGSICDSDISRDSDMVDMVNKLLDPTEESCHESSQAQAETSYGMNSSTANEIFAHVGSSPAQPSPMVKSIPNLPWDYFYSPTPHRPTSRGQDLSTTDEFYRPRTTVAPFEGLGSPRAKQGGSLRQGQGHVHPSKRNLSLDGGYPRAGAFGVTSTDLSKHSRDISSENSPTTSTGADPAVATRKAAHDNLASALFAQYGNNAQGIDQTSGPVGGTPSLPERLMPGTSPFTATSSLATVRSPASYMERSGSQLTNSASEPSGHKKLVDQQLSAGALSQWPDQFRNATRSARNDVGFPQPGIWDTSAPSDSGGHQNYTSWIGQGSLVGASSPLGFSNPSSLYMGTPAGHSHATPLNKVACNGSFVDAATALGRTQGYSYLEDPMYSRSRPREDRGSDVGDPYDKQILQSARLDDNSQPPSNVK